jgi:predicted AAA+ superfamily ATPase
LDGLCCEYRYASADAPSISTGTWLEREWQLARVLASTTGGPVVLALDEVQKIPGWSELVKREWDSDTFNGVDVRVVILGSSPLLMRSGMTESLAGRFETLRWTHWTYPEMRTAFGWDLDTFVFFGGYPGAAPLIDDVARWSAYVTESLIETSVSRDVLLMTRVDKPALLRQLFHLACEYSGQVVTYDKLVGGLADAGNTTTLAHYLDLLGGAGLVTGLQKYSGAAVRRRASSPKLQVLNTALMAATTGKTFEDVRADGPTWGRFVESAVGAHLLALAPGMNARVMYWRERDLEVDFVVEHGDRLWALEVKSGAAAGGLAGMAAFCKKYSHATPLLVGAEGIGLEEFLSADLETVLV